MFQETASGLQEFSKQLERYCAYLAKLLPYQILSLAEENSVSTCTPALETKNHAVHASLERMCAIFGKLGRHVAILAEQSSDGCRAPRTNHIKMFEMLCGSIKDLHQATKELSKSYNAKICLENELPTAPNKLRTTNECLISALISLVTTTDKVR